jgi:hypothetical protein
MGELSSKKRFFFIFSLFLMGLPAKQPPFAAHHPLH